MANVMTGNPLYIDTEGIISVLPLCIRKILWQPASTGNATTFTYWVESDAPVTTFGIRNAQTVSVTAATNTFVSATNFETDSINVDQIMRVLNTSSGDNIGYWQIATNANDNTITVDKPAQVYGQSVTLADDTSEIYSWRVWDNHSLITIKGSGITGDTGLVSLDFYDYGYWVPNLAMNTLAASGVVWIYLK